MRLVPSGAVWYQRKTCMVMQTEEEIPEVEPMTEPLQNKNLADFL